MIHKAIYLRLSLFVLSAGIVAALLWLPLIHTLFKADINHYKQPAAMAPIAKSLMNRHLAIWSSPELRKIELDKMQYNNPEWDFMSRMYFVLALANMDLLDESYADQACAIKGLIISRDRAVSKMIRAIERGRARHMFPKRIKALITLGRWIPEPLRRRLLANSIAIPN